MRRSSRDKSIQGVCGGIAEFFGISSFSIRLIFILTMPASLIIYIILTNSLDENISL
ncbi:PspC domain-containing protein [Paenibacillus radicis (ex Gao et al. 2016)]|uniref:PspC domain-containing protein n=1 Tax=Paenibacillus radicis (ex Gao et al. 2016) TaxID=1737354 RepID=UPI0027E3C77D|nr:PspC domain-containing protein [Paenibacillus radicis (ex Gao et al. 2016)]